MKRATKPATPTAADENAAIIKLLTEAEHECVQAEETWGTAKEEAKVAKEYYEQCVIHLRRLIRECQADADRPLLQAMQARHEDTEQ